VTGCSTVVDRFSTKFSTFPILWAVVSISLDPIWRADMANSLQQMLVAALWLVGCWPAFLHSQCCAQRFLSLWTHYKEHGW